MHLIRTIFKNLSKKERIILVFFLLILIIGALGAGIHFIRIKTELSPAKGGSWIEGVLGQPTVINPLFSSLETDQTVSLLVYGSFERLTDNIKSDSPNSYTATLKENLFWSDGKPLTSDDVIFTIHAIQNPDTKSPLFKNWQGIIAERVSELQVRFILPSPYAFFGENVRRLQIVPKHIWENVSPESARLSKYSLEPIGSGPFEIKRSVMRQDGSVESYRLSQNPYFPGDKPYIKNFSVYFYENEETMRRAFQSGSIDGFSSSVPMKDLNSLSRGIVENIPMSRYYAVFFNSAESPALKDKNLRLALDRATPRTEINDNVFGGKATIMNGPAVYGDKLLSDAADGFNLQSAKEFFTASKEEGLELNLVVPNTDFLVETADILKRRWEETGIRGVKIEILEPNDVFEKAIKTGEYDAILFGNILENPKDLFSFWHSSQRGYPGLNLSYYSSRDADSLMEEIRKSENADTQNAKLQSLELLINADAPAVFLYSIPLFYAHDERLGGLNTQRIISSPADRLRNVTEWYVARERVIKSR